MIENKTIFVTGASGYIGSVVCQTLLRAGAKVVGIDNLSFGIVPIASLATHPNFTFFRADLLDSPKIDKIISASRPDAVVHLAAIVGDPASRAAPELTIETNLNSTRSLLKASERYGVKHFVFSSTCSNYGRSTTDNELTESSALAPLSLYAETKVTAERELLDSKIVPFITVLRFATAHGLSARMRFDLTVNHFTKVIWLSEKLELYDANTWRPYCHVEDFGDIICRMIGHPGLQNRDVFNVGSDENNYSKLSLITSISDAIGKSADVVDIGQGPDQRNYKVSFRKISATLPDKVFRGIPESAQAITKALEIGLFPNVQHMVYSNA